MMPNAPQTIAQRKRASGQVARPRDRRASACKRGYDRKWQKYVTFYRQCVEPLCRECFKDGRLTPMDCVDHIVPMNGPDDPRWYDQTNHQALCTPCHSRKTANEDGAFGNVKR